VADQGCVKHFSSFEYRMKVFGVILNFKPGDIRCGLRAAYSSRVINQAAVSAF
jgi:hypothetical protein